MNSEQAFQNLKDSGHIYQQAHWFNTSEEKSNQIQQQREKKKSQRSMVVTASLNRDKVCSSFISAKMLRNTTQYHRLMDCLMDQNTGGQN